MKLRHLLPLLVFVFATPAFAEKLTFDHRTYPPLEAVLNSGREEMIRFNDSNPKYVTDRIAIQGTSVDQWSEALDIIVRLRSAKMKSAADWANELQQQSRIRCSSTFTTIAEEAKSRTFLRRSTGCPPGTPLTGLYRIVEGRKSLFLLGALAMEDMPETAKQQWLTLMATAHVAK